jgi:hypothetical protein
MSIVTLKRKTLTKYNNMSVNSTHGFSLNGGHRNQGYVGQSVISRHLSRTLAKGKTLKGSGGCCGTYYSGPGLSSLVNTTEDSDVMKKSSVSNYGMLEMRNRWARRPAPYSSVKPNINNNKTQSDYVNKLTTQCTTVITGNGLQSKQILSYNPYFRRIICNHTKPTSSFVPITSKEYIEKLHTKCLLGEHDSLKTVLHGTPLPGGN